jgi:hypothetical protein
MAKVVVGSSLAAMVAVLELSKADEVTWVQTSGPIGGHFAGKPLSGLQVDLGMVALEPYTSQVAHKNKPFAPPIRQNGLGLVGKSFEWLQQRSEVFVPIQVRATYQGELIQDFLISDDLEVLNQFSREDADLVRLEINEILQAIELFPTQHPRNKNESQDFLSTNIKDMVIKTLGYNVYRQMYEPWLQRFNSEVSSVVSSRDHRSVWVPLFYPETILKHLSKAMGEGDLMPRPFVVPKQSTIASLVSRLNSLIKLQNVTVINSNDEIIPFEPGSLFFTSIRETAKLLDLDIDTSYPEEFLCPIQVVSIILGEEIADEMIINHTDVGMGPYRTTARKLINDSGLHKTLISIEFGANFQETSDIDLESAAKDILASLGFKKTIEAVEINRIKLRLPYGDSRIRVDDNRKTAYDAILNRGFSGYPVDFGSSSFNDQVLLGLWGSKGGEIE